MNIIVDGEIVLYGTVGDDLWGDGFTARDVVQVLAEIGRATDVTVRLNSGGGYVDEGVGIFNALAAHKGRVSMVIDGIACSSASLIAMAGDEIVMRRGTVMMIHDPAQITIGNADEHAKTIEQLNAYGESFAGIYAERSGETPDAMRALMKEETWMTAEQAVEQGFADRVEDGEEAKRPTAFAYHLYKNTPGRITATADVTGPSKAARRRAVATAKSQRTGDTSMSKETAGDPSAEAEIQNRINAAVTTATAASVKRADAAEIAKLCVEGGVPAMAAGLLSEGASLDQAKARIDAAGQITGLVAVARRTNPDIPETLATTMISSGKTVEQARSALFEHMTAKADAEPLIGRHRAGIGGADHASDQADARAKSKANMRAQLERKNMLKKGA